ncbi:hypothetical protein [Xanthomonas sp.]|uniref:hypothetical protein n=1 Tax=Xanthomonas sp. TaxID=29446 RepID=UPI0031BAF642
MPRPRALAFVVAAALAAPCTAPAAERAPAKAATCTIPAEVAPEHQPGFCQMPPDVRAFVARQDTCEHFAGEEPYDAERRRELDAAIDEFCSGNDATWTRLRERHRHDPQRAAWLRRYGEDAGLDLPGMEPR